MVLDLILRGCLVAWFSFSRRGSGDWTSFSLRAGSKTASAPGRDGRTRLPGFWNCPVCIRLENPSPV